MVSALPRKYPSPRSWYLSLLGFILYPLWLKSISRIIVDIALPNHKWHIIPTYPMSANQSITTQYLQIAVYVGSPKYQGILQYLESPFISACQNITTSISHHQASHKLLSLSALPTIMILQLSELTGYHGIIISVRRVKKYLISLSVTR